MLDITLATTRFEDVNSVFARIRAAGATDVALTILSMGELRLAAETIAQAMLACPALRQLTLSHPPSGAGFLATAVGLRTPGIRVRSANDLRTRTTTRSFRALTPQVIAEHRRRLAG